MGNLLSRLGTDSAKILILGLDAAGKTSILNAWKMGLPLSTMPTVGFNHEVICYKGKQFDIWDIGGQYHLRQYWKHYFSKVRGIVIVIDASDKERMDEAKKVLLEILYNPDLKKAAILIFANKQDMPNAMWPQEIMIQLELKKWKKRKWRVQPSSAISGQGIAEGLKWLARNA